MSLTLDILISGRRGTRPQGPGGCRDCGNKVWWCVTPDGRSVAFDRRPEPIATSGDVETVSMADVHWQTCERRARTRAPRPAGEQPRDPRLPDD